MPWVVSFSILTEMLRAGQCGVYLGDLHEVEERRVERVWYALAPEAASGAPAGRKACANQLWTSA